MTSAAGSQAANSFPPHPGKLVYRYKWNRTTETTDAREVPDSVKFVFYDASGNETSDPATAATRVPIVEIDIITSDKDWKPVAPKDAVHFEMESYGPHHKALRHTTGVSGAK